MLFREGPIKRPLSFHQELSHLKTKQHLPTGSQKSHQNYQLTLRVLDLLMAKTPQITDQLLTVKHSITKWYQHLRDQQLAKTREIYQMKETLIIRIKKEIGMVLEQIGYYLRSIVEEYSDGNLQQFYVKFLLALKHLEWGTNFMESKIQMVNQQSQTVIEEYHLELSSSPKLSLKTSLETIESPHRRYKQINLHKYIQTKQQNLDLERQNDSLHSQVRRLQEENKKLQEEVTHLLKQNGSLKQNEQTYLQEVEKLSQLLERMKKGEEDKAQKEKEDNISYQLTKNKYGKYSDLKETICRELDEAEGEILRSQKENNQKAAEQYFNANYAIEHPEECCPATDRQPVQVWPFRLLVAQAVSIEGLLSAELLTPFGSVQMS